MTQPHCHRSMGMEEPRICEGDYCSMWNPQAKMCNEVLAMGCIVGLRAEIIDSLADLRGPIEDIDDRLGELVTSVRDVRKGIEDLDEHLVDQVAAIGG